MRCHLFNSDSWDEIHTIRTRCNGRCEDAPTLIIQPGNYWYKNVNPERGIAIVKSHMEKNQPLTEALLFEGNENQMLSDNERSNYFIKPFEVKSLPTTKEVWITRGLSSDQYLYPLMKKCLELGVKGTYQDHEGNVRDLGLLNQVVFTDPHFMGMTYGDEKISLLIGPVPQTDASERQEIKVRGTFYFSESEGPQKGIQFRNKKGETMGTLLFESHEFWTYCTDVQLKGIKIPEEIH
jgi:(2Fe-2S) ferredoxin